MAGKGYNVKMKRPVKKAGDKRRREKVQRKRLVALGMDAGKVKKMNGAQVRQLLKEPKDIQKG